MNVIDSLLAAVQVKGSLAGPLLTQLVKWSELRDASVADLARAVGGTPSSTMREVNRLVDAGLVTSQESGRARSLRFNEVSPLAGAVRELIFIQYGVEPEPGPRSARVHSMFEDGATNMSIQDYVPPELLSGWGRLNREGGDLSHEPAIYDGPSPAAARALALELRRIRIEAGQMERHAQTAYARWHKERDRTVIHLVLHAGEGSHFAVVHLIRAAAQGTAAGSCSQAEWARAVYGVWAETQTCFKIADYLDKEIDARHRWDSAQRALAEADEWESRDLQSERLRAECREQRQRASGQIEKIKSAISDIASVGLAGEHILAVAARSTGEWAHNTAVQMANHPSFIQWKADHPDIVERHPGPPHQIDSKS